MYATNNSKSPPVFAQQAPATGVPIGTSANQPYYPAQSYAQPAPHHIPQPAGKVSWSTGLCDCCSDVSNCCITCWCPCITFGQIAEIVDQGSTSCAASGALYGLLYWFPGCACIYSCSYRSRMRSQYMLEESSCGDCCTHFCCETCALCQEYRELKNHGFDMALGWQGNMARQQNQGMPTAPVVESGMQRH
ncbi:protein PLANT CADMIUM RESISTANCE 2-like [Herrania umbratica]|uniref:Protein PLANT CADMIUM RESISTANCE 2-like n=1 Tax=Herrania umbratica TaxID=108875 RepID=A0A6J1B1C1_9ROSI|nr:protein PLANT CADMIUM RESISTANCE 2-like [Herrania umbratica]